MSKKLTREQEKAMFAKNEGRSYKRIHAEKQYRYLDDAQHEEDEFEGKISGVDVATIEDELYIYTGKELDENKAQTLQIINQYIGMKHVRPKKVGVNAGGSHHDHFYYYTVTYDGNTATDITYDFDEEGH